MPLPSREDIRLGGEADPADAFTHGPSSRSAGGDVAATMAAGPHHADTQRAVLVVESPTRTRRLKRLLSQTRELADMKFEAAGSADLARAMLRLRDFDAVIIDASTPRLGDALSSLRAEPRAAGLPILVSGEDYSSGAVPEHALADSLRNALTPPPPLPGEQTQVLRRNASNELTALLSATSAPILGLDDSGDCIYANDAAARLFVCTDPGDLIGRPGVDLVPRLVLEAGHGDILRFDGTLAPISVTVSSTGPVAGRLAKVLTLADRTLEHHQQERLFLAQKMVAMGELTGGICHDFANLLTVVCGNLSEIVKTPDLSSDVHEMAEDALSAAVDGMNLTRRLVAVARERQMRPRAVDIGGTMGEFGRLLKRLVRRPAELDVRADDGVHAVLDRTQLESAVLNLVLNAQHALPQGGRIYLTIDTTVGVEHGHEQKLARITVRDEGTGMDEVTRSRATEPFYTTRADSGGTGLGLAMVANFCRAFGGQLAIASRKDFGTTVTMTFPWVADAAPRTQLFPKDVEERKEPNRHAVVVVPDPRLRRYAARLLSAAGHQVTEVENSSQVVELVMSMPPDVLLIDQPVAHQRVPSSLARAASPMSQPLDLLTWLGLALPNLAVIVTTHDEGIEPTRSRSVAALRKPYSEAELARALQLLKR